MARQQDLPNMSSESRQNWLSDKCVQEMSKKKLQFAINWKAAVGQHMSEILIVEDGPSIAEMLWLHAQEAGIDLWLHSR
jgi:hypothetical protein